MDKVSKKVRSQIMSNVRSKNNKTTEWKFRAALIRNGYRGWKVRPKIDFSPDFIFQNKKIAIFIDGCFWHGCRKCKKIPSSNHNYWFQKIKNNRKRDKKANNDLKCDGWIVLRFWEHEIKNRKDYLLRLKSLF